MAKQESVTVTWTCDRPSCHNTYRQDDQPSSGADTTVTFAIVRGGAQQVTLWLCPECVGTMSGWLSKTTITDPSGA